jgi:hypothetical protein
LRYDLWLLEASMNPWHCALLIALAGATGGFVNALLSQNGFALPRRIEGVWCPGAMSTIIAGGFAAFASWAFYGSGAGINLADPKAVTSLQFSALAGAFLVGVVGAKWITNEADKRLLKESVKVAASKDVPPEKAQSIASGTPLEVLQTVTNA